VRGSLLSCHERLHLSNNTGQSYLNGYLAFTNYTANIVYLLATYRFDTAKK
jgi:hypothetical protein